MGITHAFTNPKDDSADTTITQPSHWNADHTLPGILELPTAEAGTSLVLAPNGAGGVEFRAEVGFDSPMTTGGDLIVGWVPVLVNQATPALGASATNCSGGASLPYVIDGNDGTYHSLSRNYDLYYGGAIIDLGTARTVSGFRTKDGAEGDHVTSLAVYWSTNNADWTLVGGAPHTVASTDDTWLITPISARYWSFRFPSGNWWGVYTIEVFSADPLPGAPVRLPVGTTGQVLKIASGAPTWSSVTTIATDTIWDAAGDLAVGTGADTAAKLTKGAAGGVLAMGNGAVIWNAGTSFPGSKATGDRYWRTDLGLEFYWDGTRWLTTQLFRETVSFEAGVAEPRTASGSTYLGLAPGALAFWLIEAHVSTQVQTTNDAGNYWTIHVHGGQAAGDYGSFTTAGDTVAVNTFHLVTVGAAMSTSDTFMEIAAFVTGSGGPLYLWASVLYRLIGT
jgi:hypothetical protein